MRDALNAFRVHLEHRRALRTVNAYCAVAASFNAWREASGVRGCEPTTAEIEAFLARPLHDGRTRSPATRNQELAALRALAKFARRDFGWQGAPTDAIPFIRESPRDPAILRAPELRRLFLAASDVSAPEERSRNLALLALLSQDALRVHELVALEAAQVDLVAGVLLGIRGKGGTRHDLPLNPPTLALLAAWLRERKGIAAPGEPALFVSSRRTRLSKRTVQALLVRLRRAMGSPKKITAHTLRHSGATLLLTLGVDLSTVGEVLRHSDLNTTRRYLHLVDERRRDAVARLATAIPVEVLPHPVPASTSGHGLEKRACTQDDLDDAA